MKYFLLPEGDTDFKIMKVAPEDIQVFYIRCRKKIILEADSITELLVLFAMRLDKLQDDTLAT